MFFTIKTLLFDGKGVMLLAVSKRISRGNNSVDKTFEKKPDNTGVELKLITGASMNINTGNSQNQGARPYQEDSFGYSNIIDSDTVTNKGVLAILSDGMGGLSNGKNVADYVVQASIAMFDSINPRVSISNQLINIAKFINDKVSAQYASNGSSKAGATMVFAYIFKNRMYWITVGDSRLYCLRNGHLLQMNEDHDYKNQLLREYLNRGGDLKEIENERQKDSLVCFIGKKDLPYADVSLKGYKIKPNDTFVLCSDGIYNGIAEHEMVSLLSNNSAQDASDKIVSRILGLRLKGQDNMTIMVIKCEKNK